MDTTTKVLLVILAVMVIGYVMKRRMRIHKDDVD
jgi:hypothetical protein